MQKSLYNQEYEYRIVTHNEDFTVSERVGKAIKQALMDKEQFIHIGADGMDKSIASNTIKLIDKVPVKKPGRLELLEEDTRLNQWLALPFEEKVKSKLRAIAYRNAIRYVFDSKDLKRLQDKEYIRSMVEAELLKEKAIKEAEAEVRKIMEEQ